MSLRGRLAAAILAGAAVGAGIAWWLDAAPPERPKPGAGTGIGAGVGADIGDRRPDFRHAGIDGRYWRAADFDGAPVLINFWATWCAPCVREMPLLDALDDEYGERLEVVGIAVDRPGEVGGFVERIGVDYPILVGTDDVRATRDRFGNPGGMLPYSVLVDADGIIRWRHLGELTRADVERALQRLAQPSRSIR